MFCLVMAQKAYLFASPDLKRVQVDSALEQYDEHRSDKIKFKKKRISTGLNPFSTK